MRINGKNLEAWIICRLDGFIELCHCTCIAGLGEACSHVAALLFNCEYMERKKNDQSVTDVSAYWKKGPRKEVSPKKMSDIPCCNARTVYTQTRTVFKKSLTVKRKLPQRVELSTFLNKMKNSSPQCVLLKLVDPFYLEHIQTDDFPVTFGRLYKEEYRSLSLEKLIEMGKRLRFNLTHDDLKRMEEKSRLQRDSTAWRSYRIGRITASLARKVCRVKSASSNVSLIKLICYPSSTQIRKKAILWGCEHEKEALAAYLSINSKNHTNLTV